MPNRLGVICFENWSGDLDEMDTVEPLLELLGRLDRIHYVHRSIGTKDHLRDLVRQWMQRRNDDLEFGFFAFHGSPTTIRIGRDEEMTLDDLAHLLERKCEGKVFYFGSCSTLDPGKKKEYEYRLKLFRDRTRARLVCGYMTDVDWQEAAAFELLLLSWMAEYDRPLFAIRQLHKQYPDLVERLGFVSVPNPSSRAKSRRLAAQKTS